MKNITYILGAGASYHAIPTVDSMNERMLLFLNMFDNYIKINQHYGDPGLKHALEKSNTRINVLDLKEPYHSLNAKVEIEKYKEVIQEACKHRTIDTYAKKLWLQKKNDKLKLLKDFLSIYFSFEQSQNVDKLLIGQPSNDPKFEKYIDSKESIETHLDYRYDVFMATLLDQNMNLPKNVNILSWNYDHQLELAYMDFAGCGLEQAKTSLHIHPHRESSEGSIYKLNGSANQFKYESGDYCTYEGKGDFFEETMRSIWKSKYPGTKANALKFAWEHDDFEATIGLNARSIVRSSNKIIVIGYSFPNFNRKVDQLILGALNTRDVDIKVQCLEKDYKGIRQNIDDIIGNTITKDYVTFHEDLDQFYIPIQDLHYS